MVLCGRCGVWLECVYVHSYMLVLQAPCAPYLRCQLLAEGGKGAFVELPTWRTPDPGAIPVLQVGNGGWLGTPDLGFRSRPSDCP